MAGSKIRMWWRGIFLLPCFMHACGLVHVCAQSEALFSRWSKMVCDRILMYSCAAPTYRLPFPGKGRAFAEAVE